VAARVARQIVSMSYYDWAGGLVWLAVVPGPADGGAAAVRAAIADLAGGDGHATLLRAPAEIRAAVPVFQPLPAGVAALAARVKQGFDPRGVLNPGRMGVAI
jgi:glycolate oxidase FAD binding subunit